MMSNGPRQAFCVTCGEQLTIGRHRSGWRHRKAKRYDHRAIPRFVEIRPRRRSN